VSHVRYAIFTFLLYRGRGLPMFKFEFDSAHRILRARFERLVTDDELTEFYQLAGHYAARMTPSAGIADFFAVARFQVLPATVRKLAESPPAISNPQVPRFIVAPCHHAFGLWQLFELYGNKTRPNLYIVRATEDVWKILNVRGLRFELIGSTEGNDRPSGKSSSSEEAAGARARGDTTFSGPRYRP
jgi:hypothetical protein